MTLEGSDDSTLLRRAVRAWSTGRRDEATALIASCETDGPYSELVAALQTYLATNRRSASSTVYETGPEAFAAYIRGGGNVELYAHLAAQLRALYDTHEPATMLDIGPGDGQALAAAWRPELGAVDLVEPAGALLNDAGARLDVVGVEHRDHPMGIEKFLDQQLPEHGWSLVQATFSLQSLTPTARAEVLARLATRCDRLELSVVSFEDSALAEVMVPPLTTVAMPAEELGRAAASLALEAHGDTNTRLMIDMQLTHRFSIANV